MSTPASPTVIHDIRNSHGAQTVRRVVELLTSGELQPGNTILCHHRYRIRYQDQTRPDLVTEAREIQSYVGLVPAMPDYQI